MDTDLFLVVGLVAGAFSMVSLISAFTDGRLPRLSAVLIIIATVLIALAISKKPGGYGWSDVPDAFIRVVARVVN